MFPSAARLARGAASNGKEKLEAFSKISVSRLSEIVRNDGDGRLASSICSNIFFKATV